MIIFCVVCTELRSSLRSPISLLESVVLLSTRNEIIGVALNAVVGVGEHLLFLQLLVGVGDEAVGDVGLVGLLESTRIAVGELKMFKV